MYNFKSADSSILGHAMKPMLLAAADFAKSNWLTQIGAKRKFQEELEGFCAAIDQQVQLAYTIGKNETIVDNERLRNKIAEVTAELALLNAREKV